MGYKMSTGLAFNSLDKGNMCYVGCQEAFEWWNSSQFWCMKGCDIGRGRMSDEVDRLEATNMCKMLAQSNYALNGDDDLDNVEDIESMLLCTQTMASTCTRHV